MNLIEWPNHLGYDFETPAGTWEIVKPDTFARPFWQANFAPTGERVNTLSGRGDTPESAIANAKPID